MTTALRIVMPRLSDSMEEGTLLRWIKSDGDTVSPGDELAEIESDKATIVFEAEAGGILTTTLDEGETAAVGTVIAWLGDGQAATLDESHEPRAAGSSDVATMHGPSAGDGRLRSAGRVARKASPVARRIAATQGIDLRSVDGTGPNGRIVRADVERHMMSAHAGPRVASSSEPAEMSLTSSRGEVTIQALSRMQSLIARRMSQSRSETPDFELRMRVDAEPMAAVRATIKSDAPAFVPSVNDFIVRAAALALREHPRANGSYRADTWELYARVNIGIAVDTDRGLMVPTIFDADKKTLGDIGRAARDLSSRARAGRLTPQELDGATFTVSNLGMFRVDGFTAIVSPPQAAILSVGAAVATPVVRDGAIVPGLVLELALSCDHRILDGADAARVLGRIRGLLEHPMSLLVS